MLLFGLSEGFGPSGAPGPPPALDLAEAEPGHHRAALLDASLLLMLPVLFLPHFGFMTGSLPSHFLLWLISSASPPLFQFRDAQNKRSLCREVGAVAWLCLDL